MNGGRILRASSSFYLRESLIDQFIELRIHAIQRGAERKRQDGVIPGEHRHGGPEDPRLQTREQTRDLPAVMAEVRSSLEEFADAAHR